jgi:hypothetical protein
MSLDHPDEIYSEADYLAALKLREERGLPFDKYNHPRPLAAGSPAFFCHLEMLRRQPQSQEDLTTKEPADLHFVAGGISYRGQAVVELAGKPLAVLKELAATRFRRCSAADLLKTCWGKDALATAQNVKDAIRAARKALREALRRAGHVGAPDPIPCKDKGDSLGWALSLP